MNRSLRLLSTLSALSVSLAARADVGPEIVLSPRELAYSREQALSSALAVNAAGVRLIAWSQQRFAATPSLGLDVLAARVDATGALLDRLGLEIRTGPGDQDDPRVSSNGSDFLVTWLDVSAKSAWGRRVGADGTPKDAAPIALGDGKLFGQGSDGVVFRTITCSATELSHVSIGSDGAATKSVYAFPLSSTLMTASVGATALFVHSDGHKIWATRLSPAGAPLDGVPGKVVVDSTPSVGALTAVPVSGGHFVAWSAAEWLPQQGSKAELSGAIVSASGAITPVPLGTEHAEWLVGATRGSEALLVWKGNQVARAARIAADGTVLQAPFWANDVPSPGTTLPPLVPAVVGDAAGYSIFARVDPAPSYGRGVAYHLSPTVVRDSADTEVNLAASEQREVAVASTASGYLVAWLDNQNVDACPKLPPEQDLYAVRLDPCGNVLDPYPIAVSARPNASPGFMSVASSADQYALVWAEGTIRLARVSTAGLVLDPTPIDVAPNTTQPPAIASDGKDFLVVFDEPTAAGHKLMGRKVDATGTLAPAPVEIAGVGQKQRRRPAVSFNGTRFVVSWDDQYGQDVGGVYALALDGGSVGPVAQLASGQYLYAGPSASHAGQTLVTWAYALPGAAPEWRGRLVNTDGTLADSNVWQLGSVSVDGAQVHSWPGKLASTSSGYAWLGVGSVKTVSAAVVSQSPVLRRFSAAGALVESVSIPEFESDSWRMGVAPAADGVLVAWSPWVRHPDNALRARARRVTWSGPPTCASDGGVALGADFGAPQPVMSCPAAGGTAGVDGGVDASAGGSTATGGTGGTSGSSGAGAGGNDGGAGLVDASQDASVDAGSSAAAGAGVDRFAPGGGCGCQLGSRVPRDGWVALLVASLIALATRRRRISSPAGETLLGVHAFQPELHQSARTRSSSASSFSRQPSSSTELIRASS